MKRSLCMVLVVTALLTAARAAAQETSPVTLGTATPGAGFVAYGEALRNTVAGIDPGLAIEPRNTAGSAENIRLLEAGRLDLALVQGEAAHEALAGISRPRADLRVLWAMYPTPALFIVPAASPQRSIGDLRGQPVAFGARGSGLVILARYLLDGLGLDMERDFQAVYLERAADGPALLRLEFDPEILKRYVNFMNNPDERTAVDQFGKGDKYFGVCTLMATLPGLPMLGHGQVEGFGERYGMEFRRAKLDESPSEGLVARHERELFPLLRQRRRFAGSPASSGSI